MKIDHCPVALHFMHQNFCPHPRDAARDARDGSRDFNSRLGHRGNHCPAGQTC